MADTLLLEITEDQAREIMKTVAVSYDEGIGGDTIFLERAILRVFPGLRSEFSWLPWLT